MEQTNSEVTIHQVAQNKPSDIRDTKWRYYLRIKDSKIPELVHDAEITKGHADAIKSLTKELEEAKGSKDWWIENCAVIKTKLEKTIKEKVKAYEVIQNLNEALLQAKKERKDALKILHEILPPATTGMKVSHDTYVPTWIKKLLQELINQLSE